MMKDHFSIQEFARLAGVESSTLRYWDEIGLFTPNKRNPETNYRYYSLAQLMALNFVTVLSELDFPLKTIADLRQNRDPDKLMKLLDKKEKEMDMEMRRLRMRYSIIHARRDLINFGTQVNEKLISVTRKEDLAIVLWPRNEYAEGETFVESLAGYVSKAGPQHINLSFPVGGYYDSLEKLITAPEQPQHFFSIDPIGYQLRRAGEYLTGFARGYYGDMGDLPSRMAEYAREKNLSLTGPVYATYLLEETCIQNPSDYLVQICVPVIKSHVKSKRPPVVKKESAH